MDIHTQENLFYKISSILYYADPLDTCCVENEAEDEYDSEAFSIVTNFYKSGMHDADVVVRGTLVDGFPEYTITQGKIDDAATQIIKLLEPYQV